MIGFIKIPEIKFLTLNWIIRSIRINTVLLNTARYYSTVKYNSHLLGDHGQWLGSQVNIHHMMIIFVVMIWVVMEDLFCDVGMFLVGV